MKTYRSIIVDDDEFFAEQLQELLAVNHPEVELLGVAHTSMHAQQLIEELRPELVFMDIQLPGRDAFELLENLQFRQFDIVFTTSYEQYALQAFDYNTIHYIVKPVTRENLGKAIEKYSSNRWENKDVAYDQILNIIKQADSANKKIHIPQQSGFSLVSIDDIIRFEAEGSYTKVFKKSDNPKGGSELLSINIKKFELQLANYQFFRCHHSHLINLNKVKGYIKGEGGFVQLSNGESIPVSRSRKDELLKRLKIH